MGGEWAGNRESLFAQAVRDKFGLKIAKMGRKSRKTVKIRPKTEKSAKNSEKFAFGAVWGRFGPKNGLKMG